MPISSSCGLRLNYEAVRTGVGLPLCVPHKCHCGSLVDAQGLHVFVCKKARARTARHHALSELVAWAMVSAGIPARKEPNGLSQTDGKWFPLVSWEAGKPLTYLNNGNKLIRVTML